MKSPSLARFYEEKVMPATDFILTFGVERPEAKKGCPIDHDF
jgi:hypothetical protein